MRRRVKRHVRGDPPSLPFNDPVWPNMWYLVRIASMKSELKNQVIYLLYKGVWLEVFQQCLRCTVRVDIRASQLQCWHIFAHQRAATIYLQYHFSSCLVHRSVFDRGNLFEIKCREEMGASKAKSLRCEEWWREGMMGRGECAPELTLLVASVSVVGADL